MKNKKTFKYDVLINECDLCNRTAEIGELVKRTRQKKRTVLFAPRRYGKTSLVKNVVGSRHVESDPNNLLIYVDLMDASSFQSISERLQYGISKSISERFPVKTLLKNITGLIKGLSLNIDIDPITGHPSISFAVKNIDTRKGCRQLMDAVKELSNKYNLMFILDEFHDITFVDEAEAVFRGFLQELGNASIFILGSKRHLLKLMFANANAPLFNFGDEIHLKPILADDWLPYFRERLSQSNVHVGETEIDWILEKMCGVPNSICELGAWLLENCSNTKLTKEIVKWELDKMVDSKQGFHYILQGYTENERSVLKKIALSRFVMEPQSQSFLNSLSVSKSSVGNIFTKFLDIGAIEYEMDKGYRISDPILGYYLATH